jgi:MinD-like ATPase involved in chromosome partitioning or flagellar assembly
MTLLAVGAVKGAPGVTTVAWCLAAAFAERLPAVLVEMDPSGGSIAARAGRPVDPGLRSVAVAARRTPLTVDLIAGHSQRIGRLPVVMADPSGASVNNSLEQLPFLASALASQPDVCVADLGRLGRRTQAPSSAQLLVIVTSAAPAELAATWAWLKTVADPGRVVVVPASGNPGHVASDLGVRVLATAPPFDPVAVELICEGLALDDKRLERRDLTRWARWASQVLEMAAIEETATR